MKKTPTYLFYEANSSFLLLPFGSKFSRARRGTPSKLSKADDLLCCTKTYILPSRSALLGRIGRGLEPQEPSNVTANFTSNPRLSPSPLCSVLVSGKSKELFPHPSYFSFPSLPKTTLSEAAAVSPPCSSCFADLFIGVPLLINPPGTLAAGEKRGGIGRRKGRIQNFSIFSSRGREGRRGILKGYEGKGGGRRR